MGLDQRHSTPTHNRGYTAIERRVLAVGELAGDEVGPYRLPVTSRTRIRYQLNKLGFRASSLVAMAARRRGGGPTATAPNWPR
jgi:hypothetical protein